MDVTKIQSEHLLITPSDRHWSDSYNILLVDFDWGLVENIINPLRGSVVNLAIHVYTPMDNDAAWLLNVAANSHIVLLDLNQTTNNDILKGQLISKHNVWYTGRKDLESFWPRYTEDPLSLLLIEIDRYQQNQRGAQ